MKIKNYDLNIIESHLIDESNVVYLFKNKINNKRYFGMTGVSLRWRLENSWCGHLTKLEEGVTHHLYNSIRKYGIENFEINIVKCNSLNEAGELEESLIRQYKSYLRTDGYNKSATGKGHKGLGAKWIHMQRPDKTYTIVFKDDENYYLDRGYTRKHPGSELVDVVNGDSYTRIHKDKLDEFLINNKDWKLGKPYPTQLFTEDSRSKSLITKKLNGSYEKMIQRYKKNKIGIFSEESFKRRKEFRNTKEGKELQSRVAIEGNNTKYTKMANLMIKLIKDRQWELNEDSYNWIFYSEINNHPEVIKNHIPSYSNLSNYISSDKLRIIEPLTKSKLNLNITNSNKIDGSLRKLILKLKENRLPILEESYNIYKYELVDKSKLRIPQFSYYKEYIKIYNILTNPLENLKYDLFNK
jgi:hypothetical protein